jgi:RHS repeat-associated protein
VRTSSRIGKPAPDCGTNGECVTYDAFGRAVETSSGSAYTEIWYTQLGKTAYMNGATFNYAYWPTPGGGTLLHIHGTSGYAYNYQHKDWLGNSRISSGLGPAIIDDRAFAPYGEIYNNFGSTNANENMFTGDTQDILATTDCCFDTPNRELSATQGRWLSPDPAGAGWNAYAYATNPNSFVDPSGLNRAFPGQILSGVLSSGHWPTTSTSSNSSTRLRRNFFHSTFPSTALSQRSPRVVSLPAPCIWISIASGTITPSGIHDRIVLSTSI